MSRFLHLICTTVAGTALVSGASPGIALAQEPGFYVSASGGAAFTMDADNEGGGIGIESAFDTGFSFTGAAGYAFANGIRVEAEVGYRGSDLDTLTITNDGGLGLAGLGGDADGDVRVLSGMINAWYDFDVDFPVTPYVGGGLGFANVDTEASFFGVNIVDDDDTVFAYQAGLGGAYPLTETLSIFAGYRFFGTTDPSLTAADGTDFDSEYRTHIVEGGVRLRF